MDAVSSDFAVHEDQVEKIQTAWTQSAEYTALSKQPQSAEEKGGKAMNIDELSRPSIPRITMSLLHRLFIKSYRDVVAYGIRIVMYLGTNLPMSFLIAPS